MILLDIFVGKWRSNFEQRNEIIDTGIYPHE